MVPAATAAGTHRPNLEVVYVARPLNGQEEEVKASEIRRSAGPEWSALCDEDLVLKLNAVGVLAKAMLAMTTEMPPRAASPMPTPIQSAEPRETPEGDSRPARNRRTSDLYSWFWDHTPPPPGGDIVIPRRPQVEGEEVRDDYSA
jgi:hypothetical protein